MYNYAQLEVTSMAMIERNEAYTLELHFSDDYYGAFLTIEYHEELEASIYEAVMAFIAEHNIEYGVKETVIKALCEEGKDVYHYLIAEGKPHINGTNAEIKTLVSFEMKAKPDIQEDGTVDFKEMNFVQMVSEGEVLVEKTPATEGLPGITVTGREINGKNGKDKKIKYGENTVLSEDGCTLSAESEGIPKLKNGRVMVVKLLEVLTVGPKTGNIYFSGDVNVKEHILDGYTVECDGDLIVGGVIEGARLKVKGNLVVAKGIMGHEQSDIIVHGDLTAKFIENANIYVKGKIETGEIVNSSVLCDDQISVKGKKGLIIGGEITSKYMIEANRIGSRLGVITSINLGVDVNTIKELKELKVTIQELSIVREKLKMIIPVLMTKLDLCEEEKKAEYTAVLEQYKLSLHSTENDLEDKNKRYQKLMEALEKVKKGQVKINSIYPDTVVKIGNSSYFIDSALKDCIITRSNDKVIAIGF